MIAKAFLLLGIVVGLACSGGASEILINDDFQSYGGSARPKPYISDNFPKVPDDPNNAVIGAEYGNTANKILRMVTANEDGLDVASNPRIIRSFSGVSFGSKGLLSLEFDYRNHGTATSWLYFGFGSEGGAPGAVEAVAFNGTAISQGGGMFIREGTLKRFPKGSEGDLRNLDKASWYHVRLDINLSERTARLHVKNAATGSVYETDWLPCSATWSDGETLDQVVFGCVEGSARARYKFELDNLKVTYDPAGI